MSKLKGGENKMIKKIVALSSGVALLLGAALPVIAGNAETGNGAPSGAHYNLNIIGVPKDKTADMDNNNGHRIFVKLWGADSKILLTEGDFQVLDANGTDGSASFQLPNPDPDGDGVTNYSVYVRALGKPGGWADMQTCYTDDTGTWCAVDFDGGVSQIKITRSKGQPKFTNESRDLLYVDYCAAFSDTNGDGTFTADECTDVDQIPLFGAEAEEYFWDYDNNGLKVAQLRFYEVPSEGWVNEPAL
ncbi:MAG: hypothetical protein Q8P89_01055 [bacterium]|nr:hypothetical protein [bacterium]